MRGSTSVYAISTIMVKNTTAEEVRRVRQHYWIIAALGIFPEESSHAGPGETDS